MSKDTITINKDLPQKAWDKTKAFLQTKTGKALLTTTLILIPLLLSLAIRLQPTDLNRLDNVAQQNIDQQLLQQFSQQIQQQNPNLPSSSIQSQAQQQLQQYKTQNPQQIEQQREQLTQQIKDHYRKPNGEPYLIAIDPYYYWRLTQNVLENGYAGDTKQNGTMTDTYQLAPLGRSLGITELHPWLSAQLSKITSLFGTTPYMTFFLIPAFIASLATIPAYFLGRRYGGRLGGFIAATITGTHQLFVSRSVAGFSDTDAYNITLPLFTVWTATKAFDAKTLRGQVGWSATTAALIGLIAKAWVAWWLTYVFIIIATIAAFVHSVGRHAIQDYKDDSFHLSDLKNRDWSTELVSLGILGGGFLTASLARGIGSVTNIFGAITNSIGINTATGSGLWPNVFTTVAELGDTSFNTITSSLGGQILFYVALMSTTLFFLPQKLETEKQKKYYGWYIALSALSFGSIFLFQTDILQSVFLIAAPILSGYFLTMFEEHEKINVAYPTLITSWLVSMVYASTQGTRFTMILMPIYAVCIGAGFGWTFNKLYHKIEGADTQSTALTTSAFAAIVLLIGLAIPYSVQATGWQAGQRLPSMNDAWYNSLQTIEENSSEDAIITSWWDFGHWFKQIADRPVTFDGATQNTPNAHWVGKALQTSNEDEALSILRMLHCGNYQGYNELLETRYGVEQGQATPEQYLETKQSIDQALTYDTQREAEEYYAELGLNQEQAQNVASLTHCQPPENYFITSSDMVGKSSVWAHFGTWDFGKAYADQTYQETQPQQTIERYAENIGVSEEQAKEYYLRIPQLETEQAKNQWISPYPRYATQRPQTCEQQGQTVTCDVQLQLGQTQQRQRLVLETIETPLNQPQNTELVLGVYNPQNNFRQGEQRIQPSGVTIGQSDELRSVDINGSVGFDVLLHQENNEQWTTLLTDPELTTSIFTKLYFLDGAYTENFEKITEQRSQYNGNRIKVWKVQRLGEQ